MLHSSLSIGGLCRRVLWAFAVGLLVVLVWSPLAAQEKSVKPGINKTYEKPDIEAMVKRFEGSNREIYQQREALVALCQLQPGMAVADVGAGTGLFTRLFAPKVMPGGKVYAVDIAPAFIEHIRQVAAEEKLPQITPVLCTDSSSELRAGSVDLIFLSDTYHHFEFPEKMLASLYAALCPGGKVVLVDYKREPGVSDDWILNHVRAGKETVITEFTAAGFKLLDEPTVKMKQQYALRFQKPEVAK